MMVRGEKKENKACLISRQLLPGMLLGVSLIAPLGVNAAAWVPEELIVVDLVNLQRGFHNLDPVQMDQRLHDSALATSQSMADYNYFSHTTLAGPDAGQTPAERISDGGYDYTRWGENIAAGQGRAPTQFNTPSSAIDAAHDVMYGTEDFDAINDFFTTNSNVTATGWDDLGNGLDGDDWDDWYTAQGSSGGWMGSSGHRNTILNGLYDDLGVGYVWDSADSLINEDNPILLDNEGIFNYPLYTYWTQHFASGDSVEDPAPVPLPGAFWLLGSGLFGLIAVSRKRAASV
ncbi:MAG: CAP domain-containing protein [Candidatus Thiodiazotropha sp. DIVDIV]